MDTITRFLFDGWEATLRVEGRPQKTVDEHGKILKAIINKKRENGKKCYGATFEKCR